MAAGFALLPLAPGPAWGQGPSVVTRQVDRKILEARSSGYWVIGEGEHLYRIARHFETEAVSLKALVAELAAANPQAMLAGDPGRLIVGARIRLPERLRLKASALAPVPPIAPGAIAAVTPPTTAAQAATTAAVPAKDAPAPKPPEAAPAYVDKLIEGLTPLPEDDPDYQASRDARPGLRSWTIDYRLDQRNLTGVGSSVAQGVAILHRRETESSGDFTIDVQAGHNRPAPLDPVQAKDRNRFTIHHDNFALAEGVSAASSLGVVRSMLTPWVASSYRVFLPTSMLAGASTQIDAGRTQWIASAGEVGQLSGLNVQGFERTSGRLATLGVSQLVAQSWRVGANAVVLKDSLVVPDHSAVALATEFEAPGLGGPVRLHGIADDNRNLGFWGDAQFRSGRFANRFGGFHIDPGTRFGEGALFNDTEGAYWRSEYRAGPDYGTFGFDYTRNNLRRDPLLGGTSSAGGYGNLSLRLDRNTTLGGGLSLREERARTTDTASRTASANVFGARTSRFGSTRVDASYSQTRPRAGGAAESVSTIQLNQDWPRLGNVESNTLLTHSDERLTDRRVRRNVGSLTLRGPLLSNLRWDLSLTLADVDDADNSERNYNGSVGIDWAVASHWYLNLRWLRSQIQPTATIAGAPFTKENQVQLLVRYDESFGTPFERVGGAGGRSGTGVLVGSVFFDENGDGIRQTTERGAAGVTVVLDNRFTQTTDREGRYAFNLVPAGPHTLSLVVDRVPLPWGLADDAPQSVRVEVRGETRKEFALTRMGQ